MAVWSRTWLLIGYKSRSLYVATRIWITHDPSPLSIVTIIHLLKLSNLTNK